MLPRGLLLRALAARRSIHAGACARDGHPPPPPSASRSTNPDGNGRGEDPPAAARTDKGKERDRSVGRKSRASMLQAAQLAARAAQDEFVDPKTLDGRGSAAAGKKASKARRASRSSSPTTAANEPTSPSASSPSSSADAAETSRQGASSSSHDAARPAVSRSLRPTFDDPYFDELFAPASFASKQTRSRRSGPSSRPAGRRSPRVSDNEASPSSSAPREIGRQRSSRQASPKTAATSERTSAPSAPARGAARDAAPASRRPPSKKVAAADETPSHSPAPQMDADPQATPPSPPPLAAMKAAKKTPTQQLPDDPARREESASPSSSASTRPTKEHAQAASQSETAGASEESATLEAGDTPPIHFNSDVNEAASATRPDAEPLPAALPLQVDEQPPPSSEAAEAVEAAVQEVERSSSPPDDAAAEAPRPLSSSDAIVEEPHWSVRRPWTLASHSSWPAKAVAEDASSLKAPRAAASKETPPPPPTNLGKQQSSSQASRRKVEEVSLLEWLSLLAEQDAPTPSSSTPKEKDNKRASPSARAKATSSSPGPIRPPSTARPVLPQQTTRPASPEQAPSAQSPSKSAQSTLPKPPTPPDVRGPFAELVSYLQSLGDYDTSAVKVSEEQQAVVDDGDGAPTGASDSADDGPSTTALEFKGSHRACFQVVEDFESSLKRWSKNAYFNRREALGYIDEAFQLYVSAHWQVFPADTQSTRLVKALARCCELRWDWHPNAASSRALCDCLQQCNDFTAIDMLLRLLQGRAESKRDIPGPDDLYLRCAVVLAYCRAGQGRTTDTSFSSFATATERVALETVLREAKRRGALDSLARVALEAITTWRALSQSSGNSLEAVSFHQRNTPLAPDLVEWVRKLNERGILQIKGAQGIVSEAILSAVPSSYQYAEEYQRLFKHMDVIGIRVSAAAWQQAIDALLGRRKQVVRSSVLPSRTRLLTRQSTTKTTTTTQQTAPAEPDLMQVHEATLLYQASLRAAQPALLVASSLVEALLHQFPPRIEQAMDIWRRTRSQDEKSPVSARHGWLGFSRLGFFRRSSDPCPVEDEEVDSARDPRKIAVLADTLLGFLLQRDDVHGPLVVGRPELDCSVEIITDLVAQDRAAVLPLPHRIVYAFKALTGLTARGHRRLQERGTWLSRDDDFPEVFDFWSTLQGRRDSAANRPSSATMVWLEGASAGTFGDLAFALAGRSAFGGPLKGGGEQIAQSGEGGKYDEKPLVPLSVIVDCAVEHSRRSHGVVRTSVVAALLKQFGRLATYRQHYLNHLRRQDRDPNHPSNEAASRARSRRAYDFRPPDQDSSLAAIRRLGTVVMRQDASLLPDTRAVGAFMEACSRGGDIDMVHEIWRALALATVNERSSVARRAPSSRPIDDITDVSTPSVPSTSPPEDRLVVNAHILSIYLDTAGYSGNEAAGRRAWHFVKGVDKRSQPGEQIRTTNSWTSWVEFLCRCDCLAEAVGPAGLEGMLSSNVRPDIKTLDTLLSFAAKKQRDERSIKHRQGSDRDAASDPCSSKAPGEGEKIFLTLKRRIQDGDFGVGMWDEMHRDRPEHSARWDDEEEAK